ncbi:MAG: hypothetical protein HYS27_11520 [Deltaproteobacteria bacterium]|nr:hypothetical protein [Deltaproteobacteria bacterium]
MHGLLRLAVTAAALMLAGEAAASNGLADSACPRGDASPVEWEKIWRVTSDFDDRMVESVPGIPQGTSFSHADARAMVDVALQNLARQSRAFVTMRVLEGDHTCTFGSGGCVRALKDLEAPVECGLVGAAGYVEPGGRDVTICEENVGGGNLPMVLEHEMTHTYHLWHANDDNITKPLCNDDPNCATSDGCDGELMCRGACDGGWSYLTAGDSAGLRTEYNGTTGYFDRPWSTGGAYLPDMTGFGHDSPGISAHYASFPPRIDCSDVASNPTNACAAVTLYQTSVARLQISTLNGWTATSGWLYAGDPYDTAATSRFPPDIALVSSGANAYVVRTHSTSITNNIQVRRTVLSTGATTTVTLGYPTRLPPRVANLPGDAVLVLGVAWDQPLRWQLHKVTWNKTLGALDVVALNMGSLDNDFGANDDVDNNLIISDFDFDCYNGDCVLAAVLHDVDRTPPDAAGYNVVQRRRFSVSGTTVTVPDANWIREASGVRANAVIGVARSSSRLYVSAGRAATAPGDANNTRVAEFLTDTSTTPSATAPLRSDGAGCDNHVTPLGTIPAATQHGGFSISVCASCNGGAGTLESVHLHPYDPGNSDVCF